MWVLIGRNLLHDHNNMQDTLNLVLKESTVENLQLFSKMLNKDVNQILEASLEQYFDSEQKRLMEKNIEDENAMTNLDYNEFWDDMDLD